MSSKIRLKKWFGVIAIGLAIATVVVGGMLINLYTSLPEASRLENPNFSLPTIIYDRHGNKLDEVFSKRRKLVTFEELPDHLIKALLAKEDVKFYEHYGIDPLRMLKAAWVNLLAMGTVQGASTLTQQTARQFFLTIKKTWSRKIREILLAIKIELEFDKNEILTLYLNGVNFGDAWGVAAAADVYFGKETSDLSLSESALLVGLLPAPNRYKPTRSMRLARNQRDIVLARMAQEGFITVTQQMAAMHDPIVLSNKNDDRENFAAYYVEYVRRALLEEYGSKNLYEGGLQVYTAMDSRYQQFAYEALVNGTYAVDRDGGYRGPIEKIEIAEQSAEVVQDNLFDVSGGITEIFSGETYKGVVLELDEDRAIIALGLENEGIISKNTVLDDWKEFINANDEPENLTSLSQVLAVGDVILVKAENWDRSQERFNLRLEQRPVVNGAVYGMDPRSGEVLILVGGTSFGRDGGRSEFIRATQAVRQPGSAFKPFVYAAALEEGYTSASLLDDSPRVFTLRSGTKHIPQNYDNKYLGRVSLRESLTRSRNVPTVQLVDEITPQVIIDYARKFGFTTYIPAESLIAIGTHSVRLNELTTAYSAFANDGYLVDPVYILRIENKSGETIFSAEHTKKRAISESTAYIISDVLQDVVRKPYGTAHSVLKDFERPIGGKTGTTQNYTDAWFIGYVPQLIVGVYVGNDDMSVSLGRGQAGGRVAAPIWKSIMENIEDSLPIETFKQPSTVVTHRVATDGRIVGACEHSDSLRMEMFDVNAIPRRLQEDTFCLPSSVPSASRETDAANFVEDERL